MRHCSLPPQAESEDDLRTLRHETDCIECMSMPERPTPPPANLPTALDSQYHHEENSEGVDGHVFISKTYEEQVNTGVQTPPTQVSGSQPLGRTASADDQHRVTLFITHYPPPPPPPPPSWPQDIWLQNQTCRVLYKPVLVLPHPQPCQAPLPSPMHPEQTQPMQTRPAPEVPMCNTYPDQTNDPLAMVASLALSESKTSLADNEPAPMFAHPQMNAEMGCHRSMSQEPPVGPQWN
ncbi:Fc.00g034780.m01.CDS01 [Cosmosporella sp. VM-42]